MIRKPPSFFGLTKTYFLCLLSVVNLTVAAALISYYFFPDSIFGNACRATLSGLLAASVHRAQ